MPLHLARPETFLFSCKDGDDMLVVPVSAPSADVAVEYFRNMTTRDRREAAISRLGLDRPDGLSRLAGQIALWRDRFWTRAGKARQASA